MSTGHQARRHQRYRPRPTLAPAESGRHAGSRALDGKAKTGPAKAPCSHPYSRAVTQRAGTGRSSISHVSARVTARKSGTCSLGPAAVPNWSEPVVPASANQLASGPVTLASRRTTVRVAWCAEIGANYFGNLQFVPTIVASPCQLACPDRSGTPGQSPAPVPTIVSRHIFFGARQARASRRAEISR